MTIVEIEDRKSQINRNSIKLGNIRHFRDVISEGNNNGIVFVHHNANRPEKRDVYLERAMFMPSRNDYLVLGNTDKKYLKYLENCGFEIPNIIKVTGASDTMQVFEEYGDLVEGMGISYFFEPQISAFATKYGLDYREPSDNQKLDKLADKTGFRSFCLAKNLPYATGTRVLNTSELSDNSSLRAKLEEIIGEYGEVVVKASLGSGNNFSLSEENFDEVISKIRGVQDSCNYNFVVEPKLSLISSPNMTGYVRRDGGVVFLTSSEQVVKNLKFQGSEFEFPNSRNELRVFYTELFGNELANCGYNGVFGVDFMVDSNGNTTLGEVNVRVNGNNYSHAAIQRMADIVGYFPRFAYIEETPLNSEIRSFEGFKRRFGSMLFDGKNTTGILPYSPSLIKDGKLNLIFYGNSRNEVDELRKDFNRINRLEF